MKNQRRKRMASTLIDIRKKKIEFNLPKELILLMDGTTCDNSEASYVHLKIALK